MHITGEHNSVTILFDIQEHREIFGRGLEYYIWEHHKT